MRKSKTGERERENTYVKQAMMMRLISPFSIYIAYIIYYVYGLYILTNMQRPICLSRPISNEKDKQKKKLKYKLEST